MKKIPIAMICDKNFIMPTSVTITSIIENKACDIGLDIYVIGVDCENEELKVFDGLGKGRNVNITLIYVSAEKYKDIKQISSIPIACLLKFELCELISGYDKILYLDGDVIVRTDLWDLYSISVEKYYLGAVLHPICIVDGGHRINGGVILFNAKKMRNDNMRDKLIKYRRNLGDRGSMDQQTFNEVCENKIRYICPEYNCIPRLLIDEHFPKMYTLKEYNNFFNTSYKSWKSILKEAKIIHFNDEKPWEYSDLYRANEWMKYYKKSIFGYVKLKRGSKIKRFKKFYQRGGYKGIVEVYLRKPLRKVYYFIRGMKFRKLKCPVDTWG